MSSEDSWSPHKLRSSTRHFLSSFSLFDGDSSVHGRQLPCGNCVFRVEIVFPCGGYFLKHESTTALGSYFLVRTRITESHGKCRDYGLQSNQDELWQRWVNPHWNTLSKVKQKLQTRLALKLGKTMKTQFQLEQELFLQGKTAKPSSLQLAQALHKTKPLCIHNSA